MLQVYEADYAASPISLRPGDENLILKIWLVSGRGNNPEEMYNLFINWENNSMCLKSWLGESTEISLVLCIVNSQEILALITYNGYC